MAVEALGKEKIVCPYLDVIFKIVDDDLVENMSELAEEMLEKIQTWKVPFRQFTFCSEFPPKATD